METAPVTVVLMTVLGMTVPVTTVLETVELVATLAAICAICKAQFTKVLPFYGMGMDMIVSVHQLVSNAIILTGQTTDEDEEDTADDAA